jgi:hypothetical protein
LADLGPGQPATETPIRLRYGASYSTKQPLFSVKQFESQARLPGVVQEIEIWRVAVLMVKRYADDVEANAERRIDELETEGDQAGAAIWRRVTIAIEQLTNTIPPGPLH